MPKLLLIHPTTRSCAVVGFGQTASWGLPPLALAYVAASTPAHWEVKIVDEYTERTDPREACDLVGITAYSCTATRAYDLAAMFRQRGIPVVLGGIHASMVPDEAAQYVDAVVLGEAESVWPQVIQDVENGRLQKRYNGGRPSLEHMPIPRRDLFGPRYEMDVIQTSRGCPFACEFCSVTAFNGAEFRQRPVGEVLDELQTIRKKVVYFIDDNFFGVTREHEQRALELCRGMLERKIHKIWVTQASVNIADNPEVLKCAARSGCRGLYFGIESVSAESLKEMRKGVNVRVGVEGLRRAVQRVHECGICVISAFIFGNDHDDLGVFHASLEFIKQAGIDVPQFGILTPYPGTRIFERLRREQRIIYDHYPDDWEKCDTDHLVFKPKNMDPLDLVRGFDYLARHRFSKKTIWLQTLKTWRRTGSPIAALMAYNMNKDSGLFYDFDGKFSAVPPSDRAESWK